MFALASVVGISAAISVTAPAHASTTEYACPTSAGAVQTVFDKFDPALVASNPITALVGCVDSYTPPAVGASQPVKDAFVFFDALPASAFNGNDLTVRVVATPANYGFILSMWVDKTTTHTAYDDPAYVVRQLLFAGPGGLGTSSDVEKTQDFTITVSDPTEKAKILAGDFVIVASVLGGAGTGTEILKSISIPYTAYAASFDNNGGTGTMADATGAVPADLPTNTFTRDGYLFNGWNDDQNGNGTAYADGAEYAFDADATLYAQWIVDPSANNGGSGNDGSSDAAHLPNTGVDANAAFLAIAVLTSLGIMTTLTVIRRRRSS